MGLFTLGNGSGTPAAGGESRAVAQTLSKYESELEAYKSALKECQGQLHKSDLLLQKYRNQVQESGALINEYQSQVQESGTLINEYQSQMQESGTLIGEYQNQIQENGTLLGEYRSQVQESGELISEYQKQFVPKEPEEEDQMAAVQVALDLTYIKEELGEMRQLEEEALAKQVHELMDKQDDVMKRLSTINTGSSSFEPLRRQVESGNANLIETLKNLQLQIGKKNKGVRMLLILSLLLNVVLSGGLGFMIYYFCYYLVP